MPQDIRHVTIINAVLKKASVFVPIQVKGSIVTPTNALSAVKTLYYRPRGFRHETFINTSKLVCLSQFKLKVLL